MVRRGSCEFVGKPGQGGEMEAGVPSGRQEQLCAVTDRCLCHRLLVSWTHTLKEVRLSEGLGF